MIPKTTRLLIIPIVILLVSIVALLLTMGLGFSDPRLKEADDSYYQGESATTIYSRQTAFNHALDLYLSLDKEYHPVYGNGKLYYNIGNTFFQLGQYPLAILYYERARALMPRAERVQHNLASAQEKLQLPHVVEPSAFSNVFFLHYFLSLPERLQLFFVLGVVALVCSSGWIWSNNLWFKRGAVVSLALLTVLLFSLLYTRYLAPLEAVVVQSVELRRDAGLQYAAVAPEPIPSGIKVEILHVSQDGKWLKVLGPQGELGFAPYESVRIIGP